MKIKLFLLNGAVFLFIFNFLLNPTNIFSDDLSAGHSHSSELEEKGLQSNPSSFLLEADKANEGHEHAAEGEAGHHAIAHPFLTHMGLPDGPGEVNIRTNTFITNADNGTRVDFGVHLEAGIVDRLGFHYRNDGVKDRDFSEVMLQYAVLRNAAQTSGISVFGQMSIQNSSKAPDTVQGAFGLSARHVLWQRVAFDGNVHYNVDEEAFEIEGSGVLKVNSWLFPLLEMRTEIHDNEHPLYLLPGIKMKLFNHAFIGLAVQFPVTDDKDYDIQGLAQFDYSFNF